MRAPPMWTQPKCGETTARPFWLGRGKMFEKVWDCKGSSRNEESARLQSMRQTKSAAQLAGVTSETKFGKRADDVQRHLSYLSHHVVWMHLGTGMLSPRTCGAILILFSAGPSAELGHMRARQSLHGRRPSASRRLLFLRAARRQGRRQRI